MRLKLRKWLVQAGAGPWGSVRLALALSIPALPIVIWAVGHPYLPEGWTESTKNEFGDSVVLGLAGVVAASVAGGMVGGRLVRRPTLAVAATVSVAWFTGVVSLSVVSWLLGMSYVGAVMCFDGCQPLLSSANPLSGAMAWGAGLALSVMSLVPLLIVLALSSLSRRFSRRGRSTAAAWLAVAAAAVAQSWTFLGGGTGAIAAFACLAVGVVVWSTIIVPAADPQPVDAELLPAPASA